MANDKNKSNETSEKQKRKMPLWKKTLIAFGILLLAMAATWIIANISLDRKINAQFEKYRIAGQPTELKAFASPEVPDEQNAAIPLCQASVRLQLDDKQKEIIEDKLNPIFIQAHPETIEKIISFNAASRELIVKARTMTQFNLGLTNTNIVAYLRDCSDGNKVPDQANLAGLEIAMAYDAAIKKQYIDTIDHIFDIEKLAACCATTNLTCHVVKSLYLRGKNTEIVENILPKIGRDEYQANEVRLKQKLQALKTHYLDDAAMIESAKMSLYFERINACDDISAIFENRYTEKRGTKLSPYEKYYRYPCLPLLKKSILEDLTFIDAILPDISKANYQTLDKDQRKIVDKLTLNFYYTFAQNITYKWEVNYVWSRCDAVYWSLCRSLAKRRMAAVAIAMKQYEWDNNSPPADLTDLIPKYLTTIPRDPFSPNDEAIRLGRYEEQPLLYCLGNKGIDLNGEYREAPDGQIGYELNVPFFLDGNRPFPEWATNISTSP